MATAVFAFSGDPITYGHIDIIKRASNTFDKVVVAIGVNPEKNYIFSLEERMEMTKKVLFNVSNIEVTSFEGMLVDYAYENAIPVIVKGVRDAADIDYEKTLHQVGESQRLNIDTYILFAKPELAHIRSSVVIGIQKEQGLIHESVPLYIKQCLEARISDRYIVGITGEIGAGKSYISKKFKELGDSKGVEVHAIDLDRIGHQILSELKDPGYEQVRKEIIDTFKDEVRLDDGTIDRKALGKIVFDNPEEMAKLNKIMYTPMIVRVKKELHGKKGLILFDAALIAEIEISYLCNNNVILVNADKDSQKRRLLERNLSPQQIDRRLGSQYTYSMKKEKLEEVISYDNQGKIWTIDNSDNVDNSVEIGRIFDVIVKELGIK